MGIPYARQYHSSVRGSALKQVNCEECNYEYFYIVEREGEGSGTSMLFLDNEGAAGRAEAQAAADLQDTLRRAVDLVPCPQCGRYQANMFRKARRLYRRWLLVLGAVLTFGVGTVGGIAAIANQQGADRGSNFAPTPFFEIVIAFLVALGIAMMIAKAITSARYDPNTQDQDERRQLGQSRALSRAKLEQLIENANQENASDRDAVD